MPHTPSVPSYRLHKPSGQAVVTVRLISGERRDVYLGPWNSPDSRREYARVVAELASGPAPPTASAASGWTVPDVTVDEVLVPFLRWALTHYRDPDGNPTSEVDEIKRSIAPLRRLCGHTPAAQFGPRSLAAVRQEMITAGWCRTLINRRLDRVKRVFKWATAEELVPVTVYQSLRTLPGLGRGRTEVRESEPVEPVDPARVAAVLPFLNRHVRAMVELQRYTGMRPGEARRFSLAQVDRSAEPWLYRPVRHKTRHRGKVRAIPLGPKARAVVLAFLEGGAVDPEAPLFSPAREREERFAEMRRKRTCKVYPSQVAGRRKVNPKRRPKESYTATAYVTSITRGCDKAGVPHFHPNQLRHTFATEVRKAHGLEAAQVVLGHAQAQVTQLYAERDLALAVRVANEMG